jgi:hypothetical protein
LELEERLNLLCTAVRKLSQPSIYANQEAARPVYELAVEKFKVVPGYADHFRQKMLDMKELGAVGGARYSEYLRERGNILLALRHIQTPETVAMLASLLDDDDLEGAPEWTPTLGKASAVTIKHIIESPPAEYVVDIRPWLAWREHVEQGKQTYSFKGSDRRYNFEGEVVTPVRTKPRRPDPAPAPLKEAPKATASHIWGLIAGCTALLLGGWFFLRYVAGRSPS